MNDDLEQRLRGFRLAPPPASLDQRMEELFAVTTAQETSVRIGWWRSLALPAAGVAAVLVFSWLHPEPSVSVRPMKEIVYQIEPRGLMRELLTPSAGPLAPPTFEVTVRP
jgi:hypothetical protein